MPSQQQVETESPPLRADIPVDLKEGVPMLRMTSRKIKQVIIKIHRGNIVWGSSKGTEGALGSVFM